MEEARCCAVLDEAIEELLTQVAKKEVKLQDQRIRRDQKKKVDVERLPDAPGESCAGCLEKEDQYLRLNALRAFRVSWPCPACQLDKRRRVFRLWRLPPLATLATPINKPSEHNLRCQPACQAHGRADVRCSRQV